MVMFNKLFLALLFHSVFWLLIFLSPSFVEAKYQDDSNLKNQENQKEQEEVVEVENENEVKDEKGKSAESKDQNQNTQASLPQPHKVSKEPVKEIKGKVKNVRIDWVVLDVGEEDGVEKGMKFAIISQKLVKKPDLVTGEPQMVPSGEKTAILLIENVGKNSSGGRLQKGENASPGDIAVSTDERLRGTLMFPRGQYGISRLYMTLRPFLGIGRLSFGMINDLMISHQFNVPVRISAYVWPFAFAIRGDGARAVPSGFMGLITYSSSYFEIGLGLGGFFSSAISGDGLMISQYIRGGSIDGMHIIITTSFIINKKGILESEPTDYYRASFGQASGEVNIPVHRKVIIHITGAGGANGWAYGMLGIKAFIRGNGGKGSIIIPVGLGYAHIFDEHCEYDPNEKCEGIDTGGPAIFAGFDMRF